MGLVRKKTFSFLWSKNICYFLQKRVVLDFKRISHEELAVDSSNVKRKNNSETLNLIEISDENRC